MFRENSDYIPPKETVAESIFTRIAKADNATQLKAQALLASYGYKRATNQFDLYKKLMTLYKSQRESVIPKLLEIHPDAQLFKNYYEEKIDNKCKEYEAKIASLEKENAYSADGSGNDNKPVIVNNGTGTSDLSPMHLIIGGTVVGLIGVVALSIVAISKKNN